MGGCDGVQPPLPRHALQLRLAAIFEADTGPGDQVFDRLRYQHLTGSGPRGHPGADRDRDPGHLGVEHLTLAGVQADAHLQADVAYCLMNRLSAADRAGRPIEPGEKPIPGGVKLDAAEPGQLGTDPPMMGGQQLPPARVPQFGRLGSRVDDVGNRIVASTLSGSGASRVAVSWRKGIISASNCDAAAVVGMCSSPSSSTYAAPGMCWAR